MVDDALRLAVLIDADNFPAARADALFEEIARRGEAQVRRAYGDFRAGAGSWSAAVATYGVAARHCAPMRPGKNAADMALVIDAMDLLSGDWLDGFCIASSDADFAPLAMRIREQGLPVFGFGAGRAVESFRRACLEFVAIPEPLEAQPIARPDPPPYPHHAPQPCQSTEAAISFEPAQRAAVARAPEPIANPPAARALVAKALASVSHSAEGWAGLSPVGKRLREIDPRFSPKLVGATTLSKLVTKIGGFELRKTANGGLEMRRKP